MATTVRTIDELELDRLYDAGVAARQRIADRQAAEEARRRADQLRQVRKIASRVAGETIDLEIPPAAWDDTDLGDGFEALTLDLGERDSTELRLAFRHRGVTLGGDVLTIIARAEISEVWVGSRYTIGSIDELPGCVDDAIAQAEAYDRAVEAEEAGDLPASEPDGPAVKIEGDTLEAVLARAILELVRATPTT